MAIPISVILPVYNKQPYVRRALLSILTQTKAADEVLVIDDASTDRSMEEVRAVSNGRVKVLRRHAPGSGGYAARNLGIREAKNEWIAFLDADDEWEPEFLSTIEGLLSCAPETIGCSFTGFRYSKEHRGISAGGQFKLGSLVNFDEFLEAWALTGVCPIVTCAFACRRGILLASGSFPEHRCARGGDVDLFLRVMARTQATYSGRSLAIIHGVPGSVIRTESANRRHCIGETIDGLLSDCTVQQAARLMKIYNQLVYKYVRYTLGIEKVSPNVYEGFFARSDPFTFAVIKVLTAVPPSIIRRVKTMMGRMGSTRRGSSRDPLPHLSPSARDRASGAGNEEP